jgi:hypothetical protein
MLADKLGHPPPLVQSMILADHVHQDSLTGKKTILGTHNGIISNKFPAKQGFCVYIAITEGHGPAMLRMRIVDVDDVIGPIHESILPVDMSDPNRVYEITFSIAAVFPAPGNYRIQLFVDNDFLREVRLRVALRQPNLPPSGEP